MANTDYEVRLVRPEDVELAATMAQLCADGRIRAYGIKPGGPDYALGVEAQLSEGGLEELRSQMKQATDTGGDARMWVAERKTDKHLAGLCIAQTLRNTESPHVYMDRVFVAQEDEGNGIASEFLAQLIDWAGGLPIESEVVVGNDRAFDLYQRKGFKVTGKQEDIPGFDTELERWKIVREADGKEER